MDRLSRLPADGSHTEGMKPSAIGSPSRWTVRTRSAVASTLVVAICLLLAGGALLFVLFRTLESSAQATAASRTAQLADQLHTEAPAELDTAMLATDSQVGVVQVIDQSGTLVAQSAGSPPEPVADRRLSAGSTQSVGRVQIGQTGTCGSRRRASRRHLVRLPFSWARIVSR